jgi:hypothetical protein
MFDEDDVGGIIAVQAVSAAHDTAIECARVEAASLDLPFDLQNIVDANPFVYGNLGNGALLGEFCKFHGGTVKNLSGDEIDVGPGVGMVVGDNFGRVVVCFETNDSDVFYLGWVNHDQIEVVQVHQEVHKWFH